MRILLIVIIAVLIITYLILVFKEEIRRNKYLPVKEKIKSEEQRTYIIQKLELGEKFSKKNFMYEWTVELSKLKWKVITESLSTQDITSINYHIGEILKITRGWHFRIY